MVSDVQMFALIYSRRVSSLSEHFHSTTSTPILSTLFSIYPSPFIVLPPPQVPMSTPTFTPSRRPPYAIHCLTPSPSPHVHTHVHPIPPPPPPYAIHRLTPSPSPHVHTHVHPIPPAPRLRPGPVLSHSVRVSACSLPIQSVFRCTSDRRVVCTPPSNLAGLFVPVLDDWSDVRRRASRGSIEMTSGENHRSRRRR